MNNTNINHVWEWSLTAWCKPLLVREGFDGPWQKHHHVRGTLEDFKQEFQKFYGTSEELWMRLVSPLADSEKTELVLGSGTFGFNLQRNRV